MSECLPCLLSWCPQGQTGVWPTQCQNDRACRPGGDTSARARGKEKRLNYWAYSWLSLTLNLSSYPGSFSCVQKEEMDLGTRLLCDHPDECKGVWLAVVFTPFNTKTILYEDISIDSRLVKLLHYRRLEYHHGSSSKNRHHLPYRW